jgi:hypothetical protein
MARMINGFCLRRGLQTHPACYASKLVYLCHPRNPRFQLRKSGKYAAPDGAGERGLQPASLSSRPAICKRPKPTRTVKRRERSAPMVWLWFCFFTSEFGLAREPCDQRCFNWFEDSRLQPTSYRYLLRFLSVSLMTPNQRLRKPLPPAW